VSCLRSSATTRTRPTRSLTGRMAFRPSGPRGFSCWPPEPGIIAFLFRFLFEAKLALVGTVLLLLLLRIVFDFVDLLVSPQGRRSVLGEEDVNVVSHVEALAKRRPSRRVLSPACEGAFQLFEHFLPPPRGFSGELAVTIRALA